MSSRRRRRGASALTVALVAGVLLASVALVVDLGLARVAQSQLQAGADAAALAAVRELDGTAAGLERAREVADVVASANTVLGEAIDVDPGSQVALGAWDAAAGELDTTADAEDIDAVEVVARRDDVRTWFAVLFGVDELATSARSIAHRGRALGAGKVPWYLPFALPDCEIEGRTEDQLSDITFVLTPAGQDVVGWGAVGTTPNASWVRDHLAASMVCMHTWFDEGVVPEDCATISEGDTVNLGNGAQASSLHEVSDQMSEGVSWATDRWGTLPKQHASSTVPKVDYGKVIEGPIPVFDAGADYCSPKAAWNETFPVRGFVWGVIYDVAWKGKASQQNVWVRLDVRHIYEIGEWYGGEDWGITYAGPPVLVR